MKLLVGYDGSDGGRDGLELARVVAEAGDIDVVVVTQDTLAKKRKELVAFLRASRKGWVENFKDTNAYPPKFKDTWFKGTGRSVENELYFNAAQKPLMRNTDITTRSTGMPSRRAASRSPPTREIHRPQRSLRASIPASALFEESTSR